MPRLETDKRQQPPERKLAAMNNYYIRWKGQVTGPLSLDQAREQFKSGKISRYHEMSIDQTSWKRPDGFPELTPPPPPPPMPVMPVAPPPPPVEEEEEAEIECRCPHCKKKVFVGESLVGKRAKCPKCGVKFMVQDEQDDAPDERLPARQIPEGRNQFPANMRTMFCSSCAAEISEKAGMCPHCGAMTGNMQSHTPAPVSSKSRTAYVLLGLFFCGWGFHNFYSGHIGSGVTKLILSVIAWGAYFSAVERTITTNRSDAEAMMGVAGILFLIVLIWSLIEICTVKEDANGNGFS